MNDTSDKIMKIKVIRNYRGEIIDCLVTPIEFPDIVLPSECMESVNLNEGETKS